MPFQSSRRPYSSNPICSCFTFGLHFMTPWATSLPPFETVKQLFVLIQPIQIHSSFMVRRENGLMSNTSEVMFEMTCISFMANIIFAPQSIPVKGGPVLVCRLLLASVRDVQDRDVQEHKGTLGISKSGGKVQGDL